MPYLPVAEDNKLGAGFSFFISIFPISLTHTHPPVVIVLFTSESDVNIWIKTQPAYMRYPVWRKCDLLRWTRVRRTTAECDRSIPCGVAWYVIAPATHSGQKERKESEQPLKIHRTSEPTIVSRMTLTDDIWSSKAFWLPYFLSSRIRPGAFVSRWRRFLSIDPGIPFVHPPPPYPKKKENFVLLVKSHLAFGVSF